MPVGGQSVPNFDYAMGKGVAKTFVKEFIKYTRMRVDILEEQGYELGEGADALIHSIKSTLMNYVTRTGRIMHSDGMHIARVNLWDAFGKNVGSNIFDFAVEHATNETNKQTYQAMEAFVHNLNTMNSRAGAQVEN